MACSGVVLSLPWVSFCVLGRSVVVASAMFECGCAPLCELRWMSREQAAAQAKAFHRLL
jgi:hypothetical protein